VCIMETNKPYIVLQAIASHLNFPDGTVQHYNLDGDINSIIRISDLVLYGSLREEQSFPPILIMYTN
jgi:hypothetical protein